MIMWIRISVSWTKNNITLEDLSRIGEALGVTVGDITRVLDETPVVAYRVGHENASAG